MSQLHVVENYAALSSRVAEELITLIKQKPNAAVCLAGGKSPIGFFETFVTRVKKIDLDVSQVTFIGLDEWVGVNGETKGSCRATLDEYLFYPLNIADENILFFDGTVIPIEKERERVLQHLNILQGIDFMLLGVGMNGHLGFNEPDVSMDEYVHIVQLDQITLDVSGVAVKTNQNLVEGITLGLKEIIRAKKIIIIANGEAKANIMQRVLEEEQTNSIPASLLTKYNHVQFIIDVLAASKLSTSE